MRTEHRRPGAEATAESSVVLPDAGLALDDHDGAVRPPAMPPPASRARASRPTIACASAIGRSSPECRLKSSRGDSVQTASSRDSACCGRSRGQHVNVREDHADAKQRVGSAAQRRRSGDGDAGCRARREAGRHHRRRREGHVLRACTSRVRSIRTSRPRPTTSSTGRRSRSGRRPRRSRPATATRPCLRRSGPHGPRAGHEVLLPGRRPQQLGHGARQAALVHDPQAAARRVAGRNAEPGAGQAHGDDLSRARSPARATPAARSSCSPARGRTRSRFQNAANEQVTNATGSFSFPLLSGAVTQNTQFRVVMPERPAVVSPIVLFGVKPYVKSKVSKHRVQRRPPGPLLRLDHAAGGRSAGRVPEEAQRPVGHGRRGHPPAQRGKFSKNVRIRRGGTFRVWTGSSAGQYASNVGKKIKIKTFR